VIFGAPRRRAGHGARWIACLALLTTFSSCKGRPTIEDGSVVRMHYTLTVDGQPVDSSRGSEPLAFTVGNGQIIPGLENKLKGLHPGDKRSIVLAPEDGYGPVHKDAIQKVPRKNFQGAGDIKVGTTVTSQDGGRMIQARVTEVTRDTVTIDMNHPMAGKTLNFDVEVVDVARSGS
jgi:FKBP-type peptidyl-prolyl cis-trans isomerase SlyD